MKFHGKKIIVTGSSGLVGSHLAPRLIEEGAEVMAINFSDGLDVTDWKQVKNYRDIDIVFHLAANTYIPSTSDNPQHTYLVNIIGTLNMLELAKTNNKAKFIYASSYVYGPPQYLPIDENHPLNPSGPYSRSKLFGEELCHAYSEDYGLKCVILRAFNIYGKGQRDDFLIPTILRQIGSGKIELNDPEPRRDQLYVKDVVEVFIKAADYSGPDFDVFNIGLGKSYSVEETVSKVEAVTGQEVIKHYLGKRRANEIMDTVADISKAKEKLGWEPRFDFEAGLSDMLANK